MFDRHDLAQIARLVESNINSLSSACPTAFCLACLFLLEKREISHAQLQLLLLYGELRFLNCPLILEDSRLRWKSRRQRVALTASV